MKPTARQISAVHFCEEWLHITYEDDISNRRQVSQFLSKYLEDEFNLQLPSYSTNNPLNNYNYVYFKH